jgi:hypothetical protein
MTDRPVPADVRDFLLECIYSIAQLEALLLLREAPGQGWDVAALARRLYIDEREAREILSGLVACELATTDGTLFRYQAGDADHQRLVNSVAQIYARSLVPVTKIIHEKAPNIQKFAEAFKFRKDK